jgi:methyltransferase
MAALLLSLVTLQRLVELLHARRNTRRLIAAGATEIGADHYPLMILIHAAWLAALWILVAEGHAQLWWPAVIAYLVVDAGRAWVLISLGRFWTTRIIVLPQAPLVRRGPYRFFRHPNYIVVALEVALLPLALGSWQLALGFSLLNAAILAWRIRVEEASLTPRRQL